MDPLERHTSTNGWALRLACGFALFGIIVAVSIESIDDTVHGMALAWQGSRIDTTTTASVPRAAGTQPRRYVVRRSVLQPRGSSCTIFSDGTSKGACR